MLISTDIEQALLGTLLTSFNCKIYNVGLILYGFTIVVDQNYILPATEKHHDV